MTIYLMTGSPGSGKSMHMAQIIHYQVKYKHPVIANFEINTKHYKDASSFYYCPNEIMKPHTLENFARWYFGEQKNQFGEGKIKVFIDEAQIIFSNRDWNAPDRAEWIRFFTQHRKMGMDIYIIAQFHEMIDKQIRALVEYEINHRKVNNVGWFGKVVSVVMLGHPVFVGVTRWYGQKMRLGAEWFIGRKKYYRLYDTYKLFDA